MGRKRGAKPRADAVKDRILTRGDLALRLKGRWRNLEQEVGRGRSSRHEERRAEREGELTLMALEGGYGHPKPGTPGGPETGTVKPATETGRDEAYSACGKDVRPGEGGPA